MQLTKKQWMTTVLLTVLFSLTMGMAAAAPASLPVGVVDFGYLISQHPDTAKVTVLLQAEQEAAQKEYNAKSATLNDKEKAELASQLKQRLDQKKNELFKPISDQVVAATQAVAAEHGLLMVINRNEVIFGGTDITNDVLKRIAKQ